MPTYCDILRLESRKPSPEELRDIDYSWRMRSGVIQIERIIRVADNPDFSQSHTSVRKDKIENLYLRFDTKSLVSGMLLELNVPRDFSRRASRKISRYVVRTARRILRGTARQEPFLVYAKLEVNLGNDPISDSDDDEDEINMGAELSLDAYEHKRVGASWSAIDGLKRETYAYGSGGDADTNYTSCVICMDKFEAGTVVTYMPCSHIFHEDCLVPWLQDNNSCPLCRLELQSCS